MQPPTRSPADDLDRPVAVIVHLSGRFRGRIQRLTGDRLGVGTDERAEIRFSVDDLTPGLTLLPASGPYAMLERRGETYELTAALEADIWVNGRRAEQHLLESGDVLEIGEGGPVLRFRLYPPGSRAYKSVAEVFADCAACVRHGRSTADRAGMLLARPPTELLTKTSPWVRAGVVVLAAVLLGAVGLLWLRSQRLEQRLLAESQVVEGLTELLERGDRAWLTEDELRAFRDALSRSDRRIQALESRSEARRNVISASSRSIVFLQGSWGLDAPDGRPLRLTSRESAEPRVTLEGDGPVVEILYTGTAFVVSSEGHLLTNRHVALPWDYEQPPAELLAQGFRPVMRKFVGYFPGIDEPFEVAFVRASERLDLALLLCPAVDSEALTLSLAAEPPQAGDEVIVMGYPTGIQALLARADPQRVEALQQAGPLDFWQIARLLSEEGLIQPLATVGVIGQVSPTSVVYDAETTYGGSGGPVLDLDGRVLAVNAAILPQFGGSNLGVPAAEALTLLGDPREAESGS